VTEHEQIFITFCVQIKFIWTLTSPAIQQRP